MSRRLLLPVAVLLTLLACGRKGPDPKVTYFWHVSSSTVEVGDCSDAADFRQDLVPLPFQENSYITYKVSDDGKKATAMTCTHLDARTCNPSAAGVVFDIAGTELVYVSQLKDPIGTSGCSLQQDSTWTLRDQISTFSLEIANVLSLVDNQTACDSIETNLKARSPNKLGVAGCVVTFKLGGELRATDW